MELKELQEILDNEKWLESERLGKDACGEFPYCSRCDRSEEYPCAVAYRAFCLRANKRGKGCRKS